MAIPDLIRIVRRGAIAHVYVDGKELPAPIPREPGALVVDVDPDGMPTVTVRLMAHRVDVINDIQEGGDDDGPVGADQRDSPPAPAP